MEKYSRTVQYLLCIHETGGHGETRERGGKASLQLLLCRKVVGLVCRKGSAPSLHSGGLRGSKAPEVQPTNQPDTHFETDFLSYTHGFP